MKYVLVITFLVLTFNTGFTNNCTWWETQLTEVRSSDESDERKVFLYDSLLMEIDSNCLAIKSSLYRNKGIHQLKINQQKEAETSFWLSLRWAEESGEPAYMASTYSQIGKVHSWNEQNDSALYYFKKAEQLYLETKYELAYINIYQNLAATYYYLDSIDDARNYCFKLINEGKKVNDVEAIATAGQILNLLEVDINGVNDSTFQYYKTCLSAFKAIQDEENIFNIYENIGQGYQLLNEYDSALYYYNEASAYADSLNSVHHLTYMNSKVADLTAIVQERNKTKTMWIYAFIIVFVLMLILAWYIIKTKRQEVKIKEKEISELMMAQDLQTIEAMLTGQDNERKRIAEELHDRLGGMLSTIKIHYGNVEEQIASLQSQVQEQYAKAGDLINETVEEVRRISHNLHEGILDKFGLQAALEQLKEALGNLDKPHFNWYFHNLDRRFDSQTEINCYRIIQETISNVLRHANANEVTIQLTYVENNLNVIIEDDGKGFKLDKAEQKGGIGLKNIKGRVQRLNGTIEFDSTEGRGTTIIIDIPIKDD